MRFYFLRGARKVNVLGLIQEHGYHGVVTQCAI
jgi:hypothetical protein